MTQTQYAEHRSVSRQYIGKLAKAGALRVWPKKLSRRHGALLYTVGVGSAKATIYGRRKIADPSPGFCHFSTERTPAYFEQLLSETLVHLLARHADPLVAQQSRERKRAGARAAPSPPQGRRARRGAGLPRVRFRGAAGACGNALVVGQGMRAD